MQKQKLPSLFRFRTAEYLTIGNLNGSVNTTSLDHNIQDNELSYAQNFKRGSGNTLETRDGLGTYGNYVGNVTGILGGFTAKNIAGTEDVLLAYDTGVYKYVSGFWTALTGVTMTTGSKADGVFFPFTNKYYIVNKANPVVKYTVGGSSGDQTDAAFKQGAYIETFYNRLLVAGVSGEENRVWYTDAQLDTFGSTSFLEFDGPVIGMERLSDRFLIFTNDKVYRLYGFTFDGTDQYPSKVDPLPTDFGAIIDKTIRKVGNLVYFLGLDARRKAVVYATDGSTVQNISEQMIGYTLDQTAPDQLVNACAASDSTLYHLFVTPTGDTKNNIGITYDTVRKQFWPFTTRFQSSVAAPSVAWNITISGTKRTLLGSSLDGQVYLMNNNSAGYDALPEERQVTQTVAGRDIYANPTTEVQRVGESFKLTSYNSTQTPKILKIAVPLKKTSGTTTDLQLIIRSGSQTGTVVATSDTLTGFSNAAYIWKDFTFATPLTFSGNTTYYLQIKHVTEGSGNSVYNVGTNTAGGYSAGNLYTYASATWSSVSSQSMAFRIYVESIIDSYADSKSFHPAGVGFQYKANKFQVFYGTTTASGVEIGFSKDGQTSFVVTQITPTGGVGANWGSFVWGDGTVWGGGQQRQYQWLSLENIQGHSIKLRVRNRQPNKTIYFESVVVAFNPRPRHQ